jgi:hypothetical protein
VEPEDLVVEKAIVTFLSGTSLAILALSDSCQTNESLAKALMSLGSSDRWTRACS